MDDVLSNNYINDDFILNWEHHMILVVADRMFQLNIESQSTSCKPHKP